MKRSACLGLALCISVAAGWAQGTTGSTVYRCPGPPVLYTDALGAQEAKDKGCRTIEGAPITVMQTARPRPVLSPASRPDARIDPGEQRARDSDAKRILEAELRKEQERLSELQREYNNGEPERRGNERNYQRYLDRVAELKSNIARKEDDISSLKRELAKLP